MDFLLPLKTWHVTGSLIRFSSFCKTYEHRGLLAPGSLQPLLLPLMAMMMELGWILDWIEVSKAFEWRGEYPSVFHFFPCSPFTPRYTYPVKKSRQGKYLLLTRRKNGNEIYLVWVSIEDHSLHYQHQVPTAILILILLKWLGVGRSEWVPYDVRIKLLFTMHSFLPNTFDILRNKGKQYQLKGKLSWVRCNPSSHPSNEKCNKGFPSLIFQLNSVISSFSWGRKNTKRKIDLALGPQW